MASNDSHRQLVKDTNLFIGRGKYFDFTDLTHLVLACLGYVKRSNFNMGDVDIQIRIMYKRRGDETIYRVKLTPEEYFDPLEAGENYREDGIPKYHHTWEYIGIPVDELEWLTEETCGTTEDGIVRTEFLKDGTNWMTHIKDKSGYEEIIHNTEIAPNISHIIRTHKDSDGIWKVNTNVVHYDSGTPEERQEYFT